MARTGEQLKNVIDNTIFTKDYDISRVFYILFAEYPPEKLAVTGTVAYLFIPGTYGRGKLSNNFQEKKLGILTTMPNFNLTKVIELSEKNEKLN